MAHSENDSILMAKLGLLRFWTRCSKRFRLRNFFLLSTGFHKKRKICIFFKYFYQTANRAFIVFGAVANKILQPECVRLGGADNR